MQKIILFTVACVLSAGLAWGFTSFDNSPNNFDNSPLNFDNSPNNFDNSPMNFKNSPMRFNNKRIIRDNSGRARGYVVPKDNGGANVFDMRGNRQMYIPGFD